MGSSKSANISQAPTITPAVAKDNQIVSDMTAQQAQDRALRRGIGATYTRFNQNQGDTSTGTRTKLG